ncbi:MAG: SPOR domain-containing protein [Magnetococcales bacterium]|nr:SPOR domain-containing protein [Magnetococcales bacterium]
MVALAVNMSSAGRFLPGVAGVLFLGIAAAALLSGGGDEESGAVWDGPPVPGKQMALPGKPEGGEPIQTAQSQVKPRPKRPRTQATPAKPPEPPAAVATTAPVQASPGRVVRTVPLAAIVKPSSAKPVETAAPAVAESGFVVQVGSFVLQMGANSMMAQLSQNGLNPQIKEMVESVPLNNVQAGPYKSLEAAKEAEAKLKAGGFVVQVEETWEGHIISLSKSILLSYAMEDLVRARDLEVSPLRMVKVNADLPVRKVILGPFPKQKEAREISEEVAGMGIAVPVVKSWPFSGS